MLERFIRVESNVETTRIFAADEFERMMDRKPNVMITTYKSNLMKSLNPQATNISAGMDDSTRAESSTNFFDFCKRMQSRNKILNDLSQIRGPTGSIRGHKDVVRRSLEGIKIINRRQCFASRTQLSTFASTTPMSSITSASIDSSTTTSLKGSISWQQMDELYCNEMLQRMSEDEQNLCVLYTTTLGVIRRTFEDSKTMRNILELNFIKFEERDIYLNQVYKNQLKLRCKSIKVPALFVDGKYVGGMKELESMNENKDLNKLLAKFKMTKVPKSNCKCCGNAKFIACPMCNGSRKSTIHHFKFNSIALRCIKCNKNDGLVQCPVCYVENDEDASCLDYVDLELAKPNQQVETQVLRDVDANTILKVDEDSNANEIVVSGDKIENRTKPGYKRTPALSKWEEKGRAFSSHRSQQLFRSRRAATK